MKEGFLKENLYVWSFYSEGIGIFPLYFLESEIKPLMEKCGYHLPPVLLCKGSRFIYAENECQKMDWRSEEKEDGTIYRFPKVTWVNKNIERFLEGIREIDEG